MAVGRRPLTAGLGLEELGVKTEQGRVAVDADYLTNVPGIYAIGDLIAGPMLAHKAMDEGAVCVERMKGEPSLVDYGCIPGVCYTWPEAASVGKTEETLKEEGISYKSGKFNFMGNGRARCMDETEGFVKVLAESEGGRVLGIHILGPRASDMIAEAVTVMSFGGSAEDIALTIHAHPTLSEALQGGGARRRQKGDPRLRPERIAADCPPVEKGEWGKRVCLSPTSLQPWANR